MDRVTVVIPTYKRDIKNALCSVLKQTYNNLEIIIVDDTPNQEKDYSEIDDRIIHIKNPKRLGPTASRNIGIKEATGKYIAFIDDDDLWLPYKIEDQIELFKKYQNTGLVICYIADYRFEEEYIDKYPEKVSLYKILKMFRLSSTSSYVFDTLKLKEIGLFDTRLPSAQEYDLGIRMASKYPVRCLQKVLVVQNQTEGQITTNWKAKRMGLKILYQKHKAKYRHYGLHLFFNFRIRFLAIRFLYHLAEYFGIKVYRIIIPMKKGSAEKCG